jgi:hypothetical protein
VRLRFLQVQARTVATPDGPDVPWDEGVPREWDAPSVDLRALAGQERSFAVAWEGGRDEQATADGRVVRRRWPLAAEVTVTACPSAPC